MFDVRRHVRMTAGVFVGLSIAAGTALIHFVAIDQRPFLNFYFLPVAFGAYVLGLKRGLAAALLSVAAGLTLAIVNSPTFGRGGWDPWLYWLDLVTWGCFLVLSAYVVGSLQEEKESQVRELQRAYKGILELMGKLIDSMDRYTENHSRRVADYSVEIARNMGVPETEIEDIRVGAYLHDIGKVDVSADVLRKAAGLTEEEMYEMQLHVDHGARMMRSLGGILRHAIPMVAYHHERWDGTGYKCLRGEDIPLGARIIAVADTYDAIVTDRPYRQGRTHQQALQIIRDESGKQFDPGVVDVFMRLYGSAAPIGDEPEGEDDDEVGARAA